MKKFFISSNTEERINYIRSIYGKKIAIYSKDNDLLKEFDIAIDMNKLMNDEYFLENILKCNSNTTLVLIDVLIKNGIYVHPYGKLFRFTEVAKQTCIIDTFAFKFTEKNIVRPFLFIDTSIFGTSMIGFHADESNTIENYVDKIRPFIDCRAKTIQCITVNYTPSEQEIAEYNKLKEQLIYLDNSNKAKVVNGLIKYVDGLQSKKSTISEANLLYPSAYIVSSNNAKNKFRIYNDLSGGHHEQVIFFSSGIFGSDEIELRYTRDAILRHNKLIKLLSENEKV